MTDLEKELANFGFKFEKQSDVPLQIFGGTAVNDGVIRTYSSGFSIKENSDGWLLKLPDGQSKVEYKLNSLPDVLEKLKDHFSDKSLWE